MAGTERHCAKATQCGNIGLRDGHLYHKTGTLTTNDGHQPRLVGTVTTVVKHRLSWPDI
jgi:hypothetical protein